MEKLWGTSIKLYGDSNTALFYCEAESRSFCSYHVHEDKSNTFTVVEGSLFILSDDGSTRLEAGETHTVEPGIRHCFSTCGGARFYEFYSSATVCRDEDIKRWGKGGRVQ